MSSVKPIPVQFLDQEELKPRYITAQRQRFKAEVNRLTSGAMAEMLRHHPAAAELSFLFSYLYAWHWLRMNIHAPYLPDVLSAFKGSKQAFLMDLLEQSATAGEFVRAYIEHWRQATGSSPVQRQQALLLLAQHANDAEKLTEAIMETWRGLGLFEDDYATAYRKLAGQERERYREMLAEEDRERLAMLDALPDTGGTRRFNKLGMIPAMGCPQTCRHCMFIWRPLVKDCPDPGELFRQVGELTDSLLFTGGDLTRHLQHFYRAIREMKPVKTFAILLNGDFANDLATTHQVMKAIARAIRQRPGHWPRARVMLQISFDDFHQEVTVDKKGQLKERIPLAKIANIVEAAPRYSDIQLCLLHKQTRLNFSMDVFRQGVFGGLAAELAKRGQQVQVLSTAPSSRMKRDPLNQDKSMPVLKDASFVLTRYPESPVLLTSSTIDAYGRGALLDEGETLKDRDLLQQILSDTPPAGEYFDTDIMFWFNGWATLFSAVHMCLGDLYQDGMDTILERHSKDPLSAALHRFDRRLLDLYAEIKGDLQQLVDLATGPHHLFHMLTEDAAVRLHMTRRLLADPD